MVKMPHWPIQIGKGTVDLKLERVKKLLFNLGNPETKLPPIIHVAGTNGKGSVIAFLKCIFESAGYKVHQYTSPHLVRFNERIVISGKEIEDQELFELLEECKKYSDGLDLKFFEATTVAAFLGFSRHDADVVLLETGLGGRLDATNVIKEPLVSVITPIGYDHMEILGNSLSKIATEKAGIIKYGSRSVISWQEGEVLKILMQFCKKMQNSTNICNVDWSFNVSDTSFSFKDKNFNIDLPKPNLIGIHQILNSATAVATVSSIKDVFCFSEKNIAYGIKNATWPARMEKIKNGRLFDLLPDGIELWLDGAHNASGALMIAESLKTFKKKKTFLINGRTKNKDIKEFLYCFKNIINDVIAVEVAYEPMSENPENIQNAAKEMGFNAFICDSVEDAVKLCIKLSDGEEARILISGSLYLAAEVY